MEHVSTDKNKNMIQNICNKNEGVSYAMRLLFFVDYKNRFIFLSCDILRISLIYVFATSKYIYCKLIKQLISQSIPSLAIFAHIFFILKAMAKKAKSMKILSFPKWRKRLYFILYFICSNTASGSMHLCPLCFSPSLEHSSSLAFCLYLLSL